MHNSMMDGHKIEVKEAPTAAAAVATAAGARRRRRPPLARPRPRGAAAAAGRGRDRAEERHEREDKAGAILFRDVCMMFERCLKAERTSERSLNEVKLDQFFTDRIAQLVGNQSLYPFVRLLLPDIDTERGNYGIKLKQIAKIYVTMFGIEKLADGERSGPTPSTPTSATAAAAASASSPR